LETPCGERLEVDHPLSLAVAPDPEPSFDVSESLMIDEIESIRVEVR